MVALNVADVAQFRQLACSLVQVDVLVEFHQIPQVQSCRTGTSLVLAVYREYTFEMVSAQYVEHFIGRGDAGAGHRRSAS